MSGAKVPRTAAQLREDFLCSLDNDGDCEATLLDRLIAAVRAEALAACVEKCEMIRDNALTEAE